MKSVHITNPKNNTTITVQIADTFFAKLRGLMFRKEVLPSYGIILSERNESILNTSIHMLFMRFNITVLWLDRNLTVVDKCVAKKWRLAYFPHKPAMHVLELHESQNMNFDIGDTLGLHQTPGTV